MAKIVILEPSNIGRVDVAKVTLDLAEWQQMQNTASKHGFTLLREDHIPAIDARMLALALNRSLESDGDQQAVSQHRGSARFTTTEPKQVDAAKVRDTIRLLGTGAVLVTIKEDVTYRQEKP